MFQLAGNVIGPCTFTDMKVMWDVIGVSASRKGDMTMYIYCMKVMWDVISISARRKCDMTMYIYTDTR